MWFEDGEAVGEEGLFPGLLKLSQMSIYERGGRNGENDKVETEARCEKCGSPMVVKNGKFGRFLACSNYPTCKFTRSLETGVRCPQEGCDGMIVERRTRKGKTFYSCTNYPQCTFALWDKPIPEKCPQCDFPFLVEKQGKNGTSMDVLKRNVDIVP